MGAITRPVYLLPLRRPFWFLAKRSENRTKAEPKMKEYADNWRNAKLSDIKVGDQVLCREQKVNKHTTLYNNEVMVVISRKGSLVVAKGPHKTKGRHVTLFKKLVPEGEADIPELLVSNKSGPSPVSRLTPPAMEPLPDSLIGKQLQKAREILKVKGSLEKTTHCYNRQSRLQARIWKVPLLRKMRLHQHNKESRDIVGNP